MYAGDSEHLCCIQREAGKVSRMKPVTINMIHAYIYTSQQAHTHTHIHTYTLAHMYTRFLSSVVVYVYICVCMRACMCLHICEYIHTHVYVCSVVGARWAGRTRGRESELGDVTESFQGAHAASKLKVPSAHIVTRIHTQISI